MLPHGRPGLSAPARDRAGGGVRAYGARVPSLVRVTDLDADVPTALRTSLDLDVERVAGRRHRVRAMSRPGTRTTGAIGEGESVSWSTRLWGVVPVRHTSVIVEVVPDDGRGGARFVDEMARGAFASFRHEHGFAPLPDDRTRMSDRMTWRSPLGVLGRAADVLLVRHVLAGLLDDRNAEIARRVASRT